MVTKTNIFGVINHSLLYVAWLLEDVEAKISILDPKRKFRRGDIYIAPSVAAVEHFTSDIDKRKGVLIICDTPVSLLELQKIKLLDATQQPGATYHCRLHKLTANRLDPVKAALDKPRTLRIKRQKLDVLPDLINRERAGKFLDKLNALIYFGVGTKEQNQIRKQVLKYLYERSTLKKLREFFDEMFPSTKGKEYVRRLFDFLESDNGLALRAATQEMGKGFRSKSQQVPAPKSVAKKHGADASEITYLNKLYRPRELKNPMEV